MTHPDTNLTVREAYQAHYDRRELSPRTEGLYLYHIDKWEAFTSNPAIGDVDNATLEAFKAAFLASGLNPHTFNRSWVTLRAIFRRVGPVFTGNPAGLGIIESVPYVRLAKAPRKIPRRVSQEDLSRFYVGCWCAEHPKNAGAPPAEIYRALLVCAYFLAMRKSDLLGIRLSDIDFDEETIHFSAEKTGKEAVFPLHPVAVEHIQRIAVPGGERLFPYIGGNGGDYSRRWRTISERSKVNHFTLHDVRRTAASEIERTRRGMGSVFLQHRPLDVTGCSYLNQTEELRECIEKMRVPLAFRHGPKQADRAIDKARKAREQMMRQSDFRPPRKPDVEDWQFPEAESPRVATFCFRGEWHTIGISQWRLLKTLAESPEPIDFDTLVGVYFEGREVPTDRTYAQQRLCACMSQLRKTLRAEFNLPARWEPVPCIERGNGGKWTLFLPNELGGGRTAG